MNKILMVIYCIVMLIAGFTLIIQKDFTNALIIIGIVVIVGLLMGIKENE